MMMMSNLGAPFRIYFDTTLPCRKARLAGRVTCKHEEISPPTAQDMSGSRRNARATLHVDKSHIGHMTTPHVLPFL